MIPLVSSLLPFSTSNIQDPALGSGLGSSALSLLPFDAATSTSDPTSTLSGQGSSGSAGVDTKAFMQLLVAELQNQDPSNPVDSTSYITQLAQLNTLSALDTLNSTMNSFLQADQLSQASSLIGKTVSATTATGPVSGTVSNVQIQNGNVQLSVGQQQISLTDITSVS